MKNITPKDIKREWHLVDAKDKILGRLASDTAQILLGKNKNYYTPHLDTGDYVVVINAKEVILSGKKEKQKLYRHHSNYPGGLYTKTAADIRKQKPSELIIHAVSGMLPKTKLGKIMLKKMYVFENSSHPYQDKFATTEKPGEHPRGEVEASPGKHPGGESGSKTHDAKSGPFSAVAIK